MNTFYIRHSSKLDLDEKTLAYIWDNDLIAIHYPSFKLDESIDKEIPDNDSCNPENYLDKGKTSMNILKELTEEGGYVFASYGHQKNCKIGRILQGSKIKVHYGSWGKKWGFDGRTAAIKYLKMIDVKQLSPSESVKFKAVHPRQGTLVHWNAIGEKVKYMVTGEEANKTVGYLSPTELEVMCSEYLRSPLCESRGINRVVTFQLPIGRTLVDVDIVGNDNNGNFVVAQVTYGREENKVKKLSKYKELVNNKAQTVMFWNGRSLADEGIITISPQEVFDEWCKGTNEGQTWLKNLA